MRLPWHPMTHAPALGQPNRLDASFAELMTGITAITSLTPLPQFPWQDGVEQKKKRRVRRRGARDGT
jgi:hypothetical protein